MARRTSKRAVKPEPFRRPFSWTPERKASRECIRWAVRYALKDKWHAFDHIDESRACDLLKTEWERDRRLSLLKIARTHLNYLRMRAFMGGAYEGWPGDRPATDKWNRLNPNCKRVY
jgi:hypothetical protein